ncbi:hypothetical protein BGX24_002495 [Mortierella sp. AD032]|nr:hypothetical protein BGX24_002495 [Mortierella sp. AD032]
MIDIVDVDVDDTFDEQYNPVISAYQSSHDLFKHFSTSSLLAAPQQPYSAMSSYATLPPISLPPPPRSRRYPIPISDPHMTQTVRTRTQTLNPPPLSPFEEKPTPFNLFRGDLSPTTPTPTANNNNNNRNSGDNQVNPMDKEAAIAQWAQEQAAIEEHRLEKQRRSHQSRSQAKDESRKIRPLNLAKNSSRNPLDGDGDNDGGGDGRRGASFYNNSTFGSSDRNASSTQLKDLLEKDDDDNYDALPDVE